MEFKTEKSAKAYIGKRSMYRVYLQNYFTLKKQILAKKESVFYSVTYLSPKQLANPKAFLRIPVDSVIPLLKKEHNLVYTLDSLDKDNLRINAKFWGLTPLYTQTKPEFYHSNCSMELKLPELNLSLNLRVLYKDKAKGVTRSKLKTLLQTNLVEFLRSQRAAAQSHEDFMHNLARKILSKDLSKKLSTDLVDYASYVKNILIVKAVPIR